MEQFYNVTITFDNPRDRTILGHELSHDPKLAIAVVRDGEIERRSRPVAGPLYLNFLSKHIFDLSKKDLKDPSIRIQARKAVIDIAIRIVEVAIVGSCSVGVYRASRHSIDNPPSVVVNITDAKDVTIEENSKVIYQKDSCTVADLEKFKLEVK